MSGPAAAPGRAAPLLAHRVSGGGEPVLLLNGGLMSMSSWDAIAGPLEETHRVVRCDFRGQLLSPGTPPASLAGHVDDVTAVLDALGLARVHVVGTSFGAEVGLLLAASRAARVSSIVAVSATDCLSERTWSQAAAVLGACLEAAAGGDGGKVLDALLPHTFSPRYLSEQRTALEERRRQIAALPPAWFCGLVGLLEALHGLDLTAALGRIRCPALVVAAGGDLTFPLEHSLALARGVPGAELAVIEPSGHALVVEAPERLLPLLRAFLARASREGGSS